MKTQTIRLIDVFIIGPLMIRGGMLQRNRPIGSILAFFGLMTMIYNFRNFMEVENMKRFQNGS